MPDIFFYGTLRHPPLLEVVLGRPVQTEPARLPDFDVRRVRDGTWPAIVAGAGPAEGALLRDATAEDLARLDYYEGAYDFDLRDAAVETAAGPAVALVYFPTADQGLQDAPWDLSAWVEVHGPATVAAAREVMGLMGQFTPREVRDRYPQMLVRGASAARAAAEPAPATLRWEQGADSVRVSATRRPYVSHFAVVEQDLSFPRFDGGTSVTVTRAALRQGDAATVLPYDPVRERVLLIEQFRYGAFARGDPRPWLLEPIAGRIDPGETPEAAVRREAREEARIDLGALHEVARYYPSPAAVAEWLVSYVATADLPDGIATIAGEATEAEDIRGHLLPLDEALAMIATGEIANGPLILSLQWIALNRGRLAGPGSAV